LGLEDFRVFLRRHPRVALDSSLFIYHIQKHPKYSPFTSVLFSWIETGRGTALTSTLTMTEVLVKPMLEADEGLAGEFFTLLKRYPNLEWFPVDLPIASVAARHRAIFRLRTPDAILSATSVLSGANILITNDRAFKRVDVLDVLVLDDHL